MIIDLILDRYHGDAYDPKKFYDAVMDYEEGTEYPISRALDGGEEEDVKRALCDYIDGEYNPNIKKYINAVEWLQGDDGKDYSKEIDIMAESKNESDFGAFDWTVTVSYIDKETGDKVSDVFLIKAHNMPSAKEQAILRANRKGTDVKVDSCRMGDYVSNESKTGESSPHKFGKQESKSMNKCSMQKKIESLSKKNEAVGDELPYGLMQYCDDDTKEWIPVLVSVNENPRGWYYDGIAPTDNLGGFGYEEYSRDFLKTCKPGTGKCDPELVKAMKTFYIDSANKDGLKPIEVDDLTAYIPKGKGYIGKA